MVALCGEFAGDSGGVRDMFVGDLLSFCCKYSGEQDLSDLPGLVMEHGRDPFCFCSMTCLRMFSFLSRRSFVSLGAIFLGRPRFFSSLLNSSKVGSPSIQNGLRIRCLLKASWRPNAEPHLQIYSLTS